VLLLSHFYLITSSHWPTFSSTSALLPLTFSLLLVHFDPARSGPLAQSNSPLIRSYCPSYYVPTVPSLSHSHSVSFHSLRRTVLTSYTCWIILCWNLNSFNLHNLYLTDLGHWRSDSIIVFYHLRQRFRIFVLYISVCKNQQNRDGKSCFKTDS